MKRVGNLGLAVLTVVAIGLASTGCGLLLTRDEDQKSARGAEDGPSSPTAASTTPATGAPPASPVSPGAPAGLAAVLIYQRSGGVAGVHDELVLLSDNRLVRSGTGRHCEYRLSPSEATTLRNAATAVGPPGRTGGKPSGQPPADGFVHRVIRGNIASTYADGAIPARVRPLLRRFTAQLARPC